MNLVPCDTNMRAVYVKNDFRQSRWHREYDDKLLDTKTTRKKKEYFIAVSPSVYMYFPRREARERPKNRKKKLRRNEEK